MFGIGLPELLVIFIVLYLMVGLPVSLIVRKAGVSRLWVLLANFALFIIVVISVFALAKRLHEGPVLQSIPDPTQRVEIPGVSVLPPQGENWFFTPVLPGMETLGGRLIQFTKKLWDVPPAGPEGGRLVQTRVFVDDLGLRFVAPDAFLEHSKKQFKMISGRERLIKFEATLDTSLGATCTKYSRLTEVSGTAQFPNALFIFAMRGFYCLHPHWPQIAINVLYSQEYPKGKEPLALDAEVEPFLKSPMFTSTRPVALQSDR